jgi:hypothetical protein
MNNKFDVLTDERLAEAIAAARATHSAATSALTHMKSEVVRRKYVAASEAHKAKTGGTVTCTPQADSDLAGVPARIVLEFDGGSRLEVTLDQITPIQFT